MCIQIRSIISSTVHQESHFNSLLFNQSTQQHNECALNQLVHLSNQKQPSCKKRSAAFEKAMVKKDVKSKEAAKKWL